MKTISVKVQNDHLQRLSAVQKPLTAIEELIWNGLDADAASVTVRITDNAMGGLESISVADNGTGLRYGEAELAFENLGGSWKRDSRRTRKGRLLHGKGGKGRFRAFSLGHTVQWTTRFEEDNRITEFEIVGRREDLGTFQIGDPRPSALRHTGTDVRISRIEKNFRSLRAPDAIQGIAERFALYLREYPHVTIFYDGMNVDPSVAEERVDDYELDSVEMDDGRMMQAHLTIIEWKTSTERALYLCDADGFTVASVPPGIQAPGYVFTAYLKCAYLRELDEQGALLLDELHPDVKKLLDSAKIRLREHFRMRSAEGAVDLVAEWKKENVYPFQGEPQGILEETERQIFDVVALNLNMYLPDFERADAKSKRLSLRLLKHSLEDSPTAVRRILEDVLELPKEKQEEFAELLERTTLTAIINASKVVVDRLDFLKGLDLNP